MSLKSVLVLLVLAAVFVALIAWIAKQGGWQGEGCNGNCTSCQARCESKAEPKKDDSDG